MSGQRLRDFSRAVYFKQSDKLMGMFWIAEAVIFLLLENLEK